MLSRKRKQRKSSSGIACWCTTEHRIACGGPSTFAFVSSRPRNFAWARLGLLRKMGAVPS